MSDETLNALERAFRARSAAITHHAPGWKITREHTNSEPLRLNVDADGLHRSLRLSVWADRVLWFRICCGRAKNGWDFLLTFHGDASRAADEELVEQFIASLSTGGLLNMCEIWKNVSPVVESLLTGDSGPSQPHGA